MIEEEMIVDLLVQVKVADRVPNTRLSEARLEEEALAAVAECLSKETSVDFQQASLLGYEHCSWVFDDGMPVECDLPRPVRLFTDGSWSYPYDGAERQSGRDFRSLAQFVREHRRAAREQASERRASRRHAESSVETNIIMGMAWYRPEQWGRLLEVSVDREQLEATHAEWKKHAEKELKRLRRDRFVVWRVDVDIDELLAFCKEQGMEVDGKARAAFANELLQRGGGRP